MKQILPLLICCFGFFAPAHAAGGYLGKRVSVMYEPQFMLWFRPVRFDYTHTAILQFTANQRNQLEFRYSHFKGKMDYDPYEVTGNNSEFIYHDSLEGEAKSQSVTFFVKIFQKRRGFIAPTGSYWSFGIGWLHASTYFTEENDVVEMGENIDSYHDGAIYVGRGRQFIFADRIILDLGCQLGISGLSMGLVGYDFERRIFFSNLFRVNIGLGFIAF